MLRGKKLPQLRRCSQCHTVGHNKSRCTVVPPSRPAAPSAPPLKFFVHHVDHEPTTSPHIVTIPNHRADMWNEIDAAAPATSPTPLYHFYHQLESRPATHPNHNQSSKTNWVRLTTRPSRSHSIRTALQNIVDAVVRTPLEHTRRQVQDFFTKKIIRPPLLPTKFKMESEQRFKSDTIPSPWQRHIKNIRLSLGQHRAWTLTTLVGLFIVPQMAYGYYSDLTITAQTIKQDSMAGFLALYDSATALRQADWQTAATKNDQALASFSTASAILVDNHRVLQTIVSTLPLVGNALSSREKLLLAGHQIALGNSYVLEELLSQTNSSSTVADRLISVAARLKLALPNYQTALSELSTIDQSALPLQYQASFAEFVKLFTASVHDLAQVANLEEPLKEIAGENGTRRYLIIFQNPAELRPTGGFMGSHALMDVRHGEIVNLTIPPGGTYDLQGQLDTWVEPPTPLLLANKRWEFQDANWFPDFPASAQKMIWFYRHARGVTPDGVIAINAEVLERLLSVIGPVVDKNRALTLTSDNAVATIQQVVETGPDKNQNKPKQILADLIPTLFSGLKNLSPAELVALATNFQTALAQKEIQLYFTDSDAEEKIASVGWGGRIEPTSPSTDFLMVVNANIQGEKTDAKITQDISHQALVQSDGSIVDTVTITRTHTGDHTEKLYGQTNIDYVRVYVPRGSILLSASGFSWPDEKVFRVPDPWTKSDSDLADQEHEVALDERSGTRITNEFGKYAFGNWAIAEPGQTSHLTFTYKLPFKIFAGGAEEIFGSTKTVPYQLVVERQSGSRSSFGSQVIFPAGWRPKWAEGDNTTIANNGLEINSAPLTHDSVWSVLMER